MSVQAVAVTQPLRKGGRLKTSDDIIAYCARVSNPANQSNSETAPKLIAYLVRNNHWSPFEMVSMTMEIHTTRAIAHQILRHRSFSFQEFSQRYAAAPPVPVISEARMQDAKNRQASNETNDDELKEWWRWNQEFIARQTAEVYTEALKRGLAKEIARNVLPEGMTESVLYMAGNVRSWIHYCRLRCEPGTQKEHREVALACREVLLTTFPSLKEVL